MSIPPELSCRLPPDLTPSALHVRLAAHSAAIDLMQSNPTLCGLHLPHIDTPLLGPDTWAYRPDPQGLLSARAALAAYLRAHGATLTSADVLLTASSSEAYSIIFKVLCSPGDRIAIGLPGYPLVPHLAELEGVGTVAYSWVWSQSGWDLDLHSVKAAVAQPKVRALVLIAPHTPTGAMPSPTAMQVVVAACAKAGVVLVVDAVFAAYRSYGNDHQPGHFAELASICQHTGATLVLSGLSKAAALPQLKLGWISMHGEAAWLHRLRAGLEWVADAYLSVATPVQVALPQILTHAHAVQIQIRRRLASNRAALMQAFAQLTNFTVLSADSGWYAVVSGPACSHDDEEKLVMHVLHEANVIVHPGYYYDFAQPGLWVLGLLLPTQIFDDAAQRLRRVLQAWGTKARKKHCP